MTEVLRFALISATTLFLSQIVNASTCGIGTDIQFEKNSAILLDSEKNRIILPIQQIQRDNTLVAYIIVGHADKSEGNDSKTKLLAKARAATIAAEVLRRYPTLAAQIHFESKGAAVPVSNDSTKNRRAEIYAVCTVPAPYFSKDGKPII